MKKVRFLLFILIFLFVTTSCSLIQKEFQPEKDSLFRITFSYPSNWDWEEYQCFDEILGEPPPAECISLNDNSIFIDVYKPYNPKMQMQEWMDGFLGVVTPMLSSDQIIQIDGYIARWLTVVYPPLTSPEGHIQEVIYLLTEDRFYTLEIDNPESEIDGRNHKEFEELIKTIKILP